MFTSLIAGVALGLSSGFSPGPLLTLVVTQTLRHGFREGAKVALAPLFTDVPIVVVSLLVLARLAHSQVVLGVISLIGAVFVAFLARDNFRTRSIVPPPEISSPHSLRRGVLVNALSPHPYLFWLSVGAPVTLQAWERGPGYAAAFIVGFYVCLVGAKLLTAIFIGRYRRALGGRAFVWLMRLLGMLLVVFSLLLLRDGLALLGLLSK